MKLQVTYDNCNYGEHEEYVTNLTDFVDSFNGTLNKKAFVTRLKESGIAVMENGYATTTVKYGVK